MFLFAVSAPGRSHQNTGIPVVVMIDDFHKIRAFCKNNADEINNDFWVFYENVIQSMYTPHIFTGLEAELNEMFFEETSFGDLLEVIKLSGIDTGNSLKLFSSLCDVQWTRTRGGGRIAPTGRRRSLAVRRYRRQPYLACRLYLGDLLQY